MGAIVTRFEKEKAKPSGNLLFMDMCPSAFQEGTVFHGVLLEPNAVLEPEYNPVVKTFIIFEGSCEAEVNGETFTSVSYTHLDVYKRQTRANPLPVATGRRREGTFLSVLLRLPGFAGR